jgi:hypothetical protein
MISVPGLAYDAYEAYDDDEACKACKAYDEAYDDE